ncbi:trithorax group protein osa-like [Amphibalanus amphitrite]|uniref:trithorax group protein osa-like n=1 Tax=Amphibalanus amphitrite TaxID=1232801 RepID=UPI001C920C0C|nr:trithorax group protein osa-like [Amphibalanus amphitrite]
MWSRGRWRVTALTLILVSALASAENLTGADTTDGGLLDDHQPAVDKPREPKAVWTSGGSLDNHQSGPTTGSLDNHQLGAATGSLDNHQPVPAAGSLDNHQPGAATGSLDNHQPADDSQSAPETGNPPTKHPNQGAGQQHHESQPVLQPGVEQKFKPQAVPEPVVWPESGQHYGPGVGQQQQYYGAGPAPGHPHPEAEQTYNQLGTGRPYKQFAAYGNQQGTSGWDRPGTGGWNQPGTGGWIQPGASYGTGNQYRPGPSDEDWYEKIRRQPVGTNYGPAMTVRSESEQRRPNFLPPEEEEGEGWLGTLTNVLDSFTGVHQGSDSDDMGQREPDMFRPDPAAMYRPAPSQYHRPGPNQRYRPRPEQHWPESQRPYREETANPHRPEWHDPHPPSREYRQGEAGPSHPEWGNPHPQPDTREYRQGELQPDEPESAERTHPERVRQYRQGSADPNRPDVDQHLRPASSEPYQRKPSEPYQRRPAEPYQRRPPPPGQGPTADRRYDTPFGPQPNNDAGLFAYPSDFIADLKNVAWWCFVIFGAFLLNLVVYNAVSSPLEAILAVNGTLNATGAAL